MPHLRLRLTIAHQRNKSDRTQLTLDERTIPIFLQEKKHLIIGGRGSNGCNQAASVRQLFDQRRWEPLRRSRHNDGFERGFFGPSKRAVTNTKMDIPIAEASKS